MPIEFGRDTGGDLTDYLFRQLDLIEDALNNGQTEVKLAERNSEPDRPRAGMIVLADGTNWDPGSGQGVYAYYNGSWNKLG